LRDFNVHEAIKLNEENTDEKRGGIIIFNPWKTLRETRC